MSPESRVVRQGPRVSRSDWERLNCHRGGVVWFTGPPGAGKTTLAREIELCLFRSGVRCCVLDGDEVRQGLCRDLGFSRADRRENLRRVGEVCKILSGVGVLVLAAFVSPYRDDRKMVRSIIGADSFIEVYVRCSPFVCEMRDPKGLYRRARRGEIQYFTGLSDPYEEPENPDLVLDTEVSSVEACVSEVLDLLRRKGWIPSARARA